MMMPLAVVHVAITYRSAIDHEIETVGPLVGKPKGFNLVEYTNDQWSATLGIGHKLTDQWSGNISVGWDLGAGDPVTTLGPVNGL